MQPSLLSPRRSTLAEAANSEIATRLAGLMPLAATLVDIVRTLAGEWGDEARGGAALLERSDAAVAGKLAPGCHADAGVVGRSEAAPGRDRSDRARDGRRNAVRLPVRSAAPAPLDRLHGGRERSTPIATTCSPPKLAWRASSPSQRTTFRPATGFGSDDRSHRSGKGAALISWSGSMFEYLMPSLVMRAPAGSLLEQTSRLIVERQIRYAAELGIPWGISESAYNARDLELTYQYSNFGVPGLGLKRGLRENAVIAPYATALAAMVDPQSAMRNFERLTAHRRARPIWLSRSARLHALACPGRCRGRHRSGLHGASSGHDHRGHRERPARRQRCARDFTPSRAFRRRNCSCRSARRAMSRWFVRGRRRCRAAAPLADTRLPEVRRLHSAHDATPQTHLLSNGRYSVMLTSAGSGYSRWRDIGGDTLAGGRHAGRHGQLHLSAGRRRAAPYGRRAISRAASSPRPTRSPLPRIARNSFARTGRSRRPWRSSYRPRTTPRSGACRSPIAVIATERSRSHPIWNSCSRRLRQTPPIRPSRSSSFKRNTSPSATRSWRRAASARPRSPTSGRLIMRSSKAPHWASRKSKRIGRASWAADVKSDRRLP